MLSRSKKTQHKTAGNFKEDQLADSAFSVYTRLRDADRFGNVKCCTCHRVMPWQEMQNGHWQGRWKASTRWAEENGNPQCGICNTSPEADRIKGYYDKYMIGRWGAEKTAEIEAQSNLTYKYTREEQIDIGLTYWYRAQEIASRLGIALRHAKIEAQIAFWRPAAQRSEKPE